MRRKITNSKIAALAGATIRRVRGDIRRQPSVLLMALVAGVAAIFVFNASVAAVWTLFVLFLVYDWDIRAAIAAGAVSLALCILFAGMGNMAWLETAAVYTYFFFGIAAMVWFVKYARVTALR